MVTARSFNPVNLDGTPLSTAQMQALEQAIRYLSQDPRAAALLQQAADRRVAIKLHSRPDGGYDPSANHIEWNPAYSIRVRDGQDTGYLSAAMVLLHEVAHSVDPQPRIKYIAPNDPCPTGEVCQETADVYEQRMYNTREKFATETETEIARSLGEPVRATYLDTVGGRNVASPLHSSREYRQGNFRYREVSEGHAREADGSVFTRTITTQQDRRTESIHTKKSDENFQPVSESIARYDHQRGIISTTTTHYQILDADGKPTVTNKLTDLRGNPIHSSEQNPAPDVSKTEPPSPLSQLAQRVLNSSRAELDQMGRDIANSPLGEQFRQRGAELWEERQAELRRQEQEAQEWARQQEQEKAQQHIHRGPVMR